MFFAGFDLLFSILFPILFLVVLGMILYAIIGNIRTWNKNNHSPRLTVPAAVVAKHPLSWVPAELSVSALLPNWMNRKLNKAGLHTKKHLLPLCRT